MKRLLLTLSLFIIAICSFSQTVRLNQALSDYYKVYTDVSDEYAIEISQKMEAALVLFNEIFHFDLSTLETKFKVTIYSQKSGFDTYLQRLLGQTRDDFVYIHYTDLRKSELVGFKKSDDDDMISSLLHQGLIQFVKTFIPNIPIWISEGAAAYIENSTYATGSVSTETADETSGYSEDEYSEDEYDEEEFDEPALTGEAGYFLLNKSLVWLDSLKSLIKGESGNSILPMEELLTIDKVTAVTLIDIFYPQAWGLVFFLLNTQDKDYNRLFWDSLNILDPSKSLKDNSEAVKDLIVKWKKPDILYADFKSYILSLKTFNDYVKAGLDFYNDDEYKEAEENFLAAVDLRPGHYFPHYYLGLISYANKNYYAAEEYYLKALELGADKALTYYALGVNAYADNNFDSAESFLTSSLEENREKYKEKVELLLQRIESERIDEDLYMDYESETEPDLETEYDEFDEKEEYDEFDEEDEFDETDEFDEEEEYDEFDEEEEYDEFDEEEEFDEDTGM